MSEAARERDRRMGERRQPRRSPTADESWFGAFGSAEDTQVSQYENSPEMKAKAGDSAAAPASSTSDSRLFSRQAERIVSAGQTAFDRIYRTFIGARAALGVALVVFTAQALVSARWLRLFRFGPAEWVWRSLTYGHRQPLRLRPAA